MEVYDKENNSWSVEEQGHIPPKNIAAVDIEGRVYFIVNKFLIDSGIRIPPDEAYNVFLNQWKNMSEVMGDAVLCYLPVKSGNLRAEQSESQVLHMIAQYITHRLSRYVIACLQYFVLEE